MGSDAYIKNFSPFIKLFGQENPEKHEMFVFIDQRHYVEVNELTKSISNITLISIDENFMNTHIHAWKLLPREREIMGSVEYKELMAHRLQFPEHRNPEYTLINHAKIDFVNYAMILTKAQKFCWVDFGYFKLPQNIPDRLVDENKLNWSVITYTLINHLTPEDSDIMHTLYFANERIGGYFFSGCRDAMKEYQRIYHSNLESFQSKNIADDDQHLALRCYFERPDLINLHYFGAWHHALVGFQID